MHKHLKQISLSYNKSLVFLTVILYLVFLSGCDNKPANAAGGFSPPGVSVAEVIERSITPWQQYNGRIEAKEIVEVKPRVGGVIQKIRFRDGARVKKGDVLYVLDQQSYKAELKGAIANLTRAQAQASVAKSEVKRAKGLVNRDLLSPEKYDQLMATENQALANVEATNATMELASLNLSYTKIRAPINGYISRTRITKGNLVSSSPTPDLLSTIHTLDPIYVVFDVDETSYLNYFIDAKRTKKKNEEHHVFVGLGNEADFPHEAKIDFIDNKISRDSGTIQLRAVMDNRDLHLLPGLFARVKLPVSKSKNAILIDERAILTDQDRQYVYTINEKNQALRRDIKIGRFIDGLRVVSEGLNVGDKIIVHGIQKVFFPGMEVNPQTIRMGESAPVPKPSVKDS